MRCLNPEGLALEGCKWRVSSKGAGEGAGEAQAAYKRVQLYKKAHRQGRMPRGMHECRQAVCRRCCRLGAGEDTGEGTGGAQTRAKLRRGHGHNRGEGENRAQAQALGQAGSPVLGGARSPVGGERASEIMHFPILSH